MTVAGTLIAESIRDGGVLELDVRLLRMFRQPVPLPGVDQQSQPMWTFIDFRCDDDAHAATFAQQLSAAMLAGPWYCDMGNDTHKWVVFAGKVLHYQRGDDDARLQAIAYARQVGVPERQLDWAS